MEKTIATSIRIPESLKNELENIAQNDNRSLNNLINIILQAYVKESQSDKKTK